jgi:hypothetical protein
MPLKLNISKLNLKIVSTQSMHCLFALLLIILHSVLSGPVLAQPSGIASPQLGKPYDFYARGPYRAGVPRPSAILGYEAGETHTNYRDQERVLLGIAAAAKDRVRVVEYGRSVEGRPLRLFIVTAPENIARLEAIRDSIARLADPRRLASEAEAETLVKNTPVISWVNHCIHGDETASFETVMWTLYTLAASETTDIRATLRNSVVILNPAYNPDGHERFVVYYNSIAVGSPESLAYEKREPWAVSGRFNHFRFDMNRDKLAQSQPETRQETAAFLHWHPQVYVDEHGQPENYFFPPNALAINRNTDRARVEKWTDIFGRANGAAFDRYGWQYVTRDTFDFFYPGYLDSWTTLSGAIGMTYETDGGGNLARRRSDSTISTLRDATAHHFEAALATVQAAADHHEPLLRDFLAYRRAAIQVGKTEKMRRIVILPGSDPNRAAELAAVLLRVGVEVQEANTPFTSTVAHAYLPPQPAATGENPKSKIQNPKPVSFPSGALIVDLAQPQGYVARAFLEPDPDFESEFTAEQYARRARNEKKNDNERKEDYGFYDITAWALPYAYGLEAYWTEDAPDVASRPLALELPRPTTTRPESRHGDGPLDIIAGGELMARSEAQVALRGEVRLHTQTGGVPGGKATVAYLFAYDRDASATLALRLLQEDYRLATATKPVRAGGKQWPRGTLIAYVSRNPASLHARIVQLAQELGVDVTTLNSAYGDASPVSLGSESVVSVKRPRIAVIADDNVDQTSYGALWYLLSRQVGLNFTPVPLNALQSETLSQFNVVIVPDGSGYGGALGKSGMAALKEWIGRGNVLIALGGGDWFTDKEQGLSTAVPVGEEEKQEDKEKEPKPAEKAKPKKPVSLAGAIFRAQIDATHFLGYGYPSGEIVVPLAGETFLQPSKQGANVVTFGKGPSRLSGFIWPDNTEELLANTAYVIDEPIGSGHAILFLNDPNFRALWAGLRRCFLSGILYGPARNALRPEGE